MRLYTWLAMGIALATAAYLNPQRGVADGLAPRPSSGVYADRRLHVDGSGLVTSGGREVVLRGINLGGWLVIETWMCGIVDDKDVHVGSGGGGGTGRSTQESLEERFGAERAETLLRAWQDHWITSRDLDAIRDGGFNLVRVPISYRTLQHADGRWITDARDQIDFSRMDWIVREAAERGIYTVFDLHVWPGQRFAYDRIGRPEGAPAREAMARLWIAIANHYRGNGAIAAFDLINEFPGNWGVQQLLSRAVRQADPTRIQIIEGFTLAEFVKLRDAGEFPNSIFSDHFYDAKPLTTALFRARLDALSSSPVPVYIGEFLAEDFAATTQIMNERKIAWSSWTYKTVDMGDWGAFNYYPQLKTDIQHDPFATILAKWSDDLTAWQAPNTTNNFSLNQERRVVLDSTPGAPEKLTAALLPLTAPAARSLLPS